MADSTNLHKSYYEQFVTEGIKRMVLNCFGIEKLKKHVNSEMGKPGYISLSRWDLLAGGYTSQLCADKLREAGDFPSLAGAVCILKAAARMIVNVAQ